LLRRGTLHAGSVPQVAVEGKADIGEVGDHIRAHLIEPIPVESARNAEVDLLSSAAFRA
jgi:hypothetical protein